MSIQALMRRTPIGQISDMEYSGKHCVIRASRKARADKLHPLTESGRRSLVKRIRNEMRHIDNMRRTNPTYMWSRCKALRAELHALENMRVEVAA